MNTKQCPLWSGSLQCMMCEGFHFTLLLRLYMDTSPQQKYTARCSNEKVYHFKSGPFSKTYHFSWNWKFQLGKDITFLDAFDILAAETAKENVKPGHRAPRHAALHFTLCRPCLTPLSCFFFEAHSPVQLAVCSSIYFCSYSHLSCNVQ